MEWGSSCWWGRFGHIERLTLCHTRTGGVRCPTNRFSPGSPMVSRDEKSLTGQVSRQRHLLRACSESNSPRPHITVAVYARATRDPAAVVTAYGAGGVVRPAETIGTSVVSVTTHQAPAVVGARGSTVLTAEFSGAASPRVRERLPHDTLALARTASGPNRVRRTNLRSSGTRTSHGLGT